MSIVATYPLNEILCCTAVSSRFFRNSSGPILRAGELLHQLGTRPKFELSMIVSGLYRILVGLFLKVVLADNISPFVDAGFATPASSLSALDVWTLAFLFGFQIYFDFSAYSHIAVGSALLMGITFPENFNFPYMATSPREFWRRWHISLSSWIRDYLYLPLLGVKVKDRSAGGIDAAVQGNAASTTNPTLILLLTWGIMGFWHGANWTFVIWGLYHAVMIVGYRIIAPLTEGLPSFLRRGGGWLITLPLMMLAWIPFRAQTVNQTIGMLERLVDPRGYLWMGMRENTYVVAAVCMFCVLISFVYRDFAHRFVGQHAALRFTTDAVSASVLIAGVFVFLRPISQFIYFQF